MTTATPDSARPGVSVVIPVHNGAQWIDDVVAGVEAQHYEGPIEILAVEDGSTDGSDEMLRRHADAGRLTVIAGPRRGAAAAINAGIAAAVHPLIAQIDQDVVLQPGWLDRLTAALADESVAAAQGHYQHHPGAGIWARVMALDLTLRYSELTGGRTSHVCTGNSVYRKSALVEAGLFDETLGYGYDNDMSYRLAERGHSLAFVPAARSVHHWREGLLDYMRQQYGFGYGRIDLVAKHRRRITGDAVSRVPMMLHAPVMGLAVLVMLAAGVLAMLGEPASPVAAAGLGLVSLLAAERLVAGLRAAVRFRNPAGLWFVPAHVLRDLAWVGAIVVWTTRRVAGAGRRPSDSMTPRNSSPRMVNRSKP